tara:strand:- start:263 stop:625 length:363 start_codon:yes stop_codon:yes gene_type:complete
MSEVQGKIKVIGDIQTFGANGFRKAELVLDVTEKPEYPQFVNIDITQDNTDLLKNYKVGDEVKVAYNLGGRLWTNPQGVDKYFNSITGWKIENIATAPNIPQPPIGSTPIANAEPDDLPF